MAGTVHAPAISTPTAMAAATKHSLRFISNVSFPQYSRQSRVGRRASPVSQVLLLPPPLLSSCDCRSPTPDCRVSALCRLGHLPRSPDEEPPLDQRHEGVDDDDHDR